MHIPYCSGKCYYCDFLSFPEGKGFLQPEEYIALLCREIELRGREISESGHRVTTLYIGGGTPTFLAGPQLARLLCACLNYLPLDHPEWTVEANPDSINRNKLAMMSDHGVTRLSLGIQAMDNHLLDLLGRRYDTDAAKKAYDDCRNYIPSLSVDLMYGLPCQDVHGYLFGLKTVLDLEPDHLSLYGLKLEEGTSLSNKVAAGALSLPSEDEILAMMLEGKELAERRGYLHYEIASFAKPGHTCRHNLTYWYNLPYIGIGLGSHSYWQGQRLENTTCLEKYRSFLLDCSVPVAEFTDVPERQIIEDTMMLGLRIITGVTHARFYQNFGKNIRDVFGAELAYLEKHGLIIVDSEGVRLSQRGLPLANFVFAEFITIEPTEA